MAVQSTWNSISSIHNSRLPPTGPKIIQKTYHLKTSPSQWLSRHVHQSCPKLSTDKGSMDRHKLNRAGNNLAIPPMQPSMVRTEILQIPWLLLLRLDKSHFLLLLKPAHNLLVTQVLQELVNLGRIQDGQQASLKAKLLQQLSTLLHYLVLLDLLEEMMIHLLLQLQLLQLLQLLLHLHRLLLLLQL